MRPFACDKMLGTCIHIYIYVYMYALLKFNMEPEIFSPWKRSCSRCHVVLKKRRVTAEEENLPISPVGLALWPSHPTADTSAIAYQRQPLKIGALIQNAFSKNSLLYTILYHIIITVTTLGIISKILEVHITWCNFFAHQNASLLPLAMPRLTPSGLLSNGWQRVAAADARLPWGPRWDTSSMPVQNGQTWFGCWFIASRRLRVVHGSRSTSRWNPVKSLIITWYQMIWQQRRALLNFIPLPRSKSFHRGCRSFSKDLGFSTGAKYVDSAVNIQRVSLRPTWMVFVVWKI